MLNDLNHRNLLNSSSVRPAAAGRPRHPGRLDPDPGRGGHRRGDGRRPRPRGLLPRGNADHARHPDHLDQGHPALHRGARRRDDTAPRAASAGMARMLETYPFGEAPRHAARRPFASGDASAAIDWLDKMRLEFKNPHEMLVAWIQDLLTYVATTWGEEAVLESILETHQSIWGDRYARWDQMTPHEKLALTVEGMRGGHFSGARRRGDMTAARRRRPLRAWSWSRAAPAACCAAAIRRPAVRLPDRRARRQPGAARVDLAEDRRPLVLQPLLRSPWSGCRAAARPAAAPARSRHGPEAPCTWYVYKDEAQTRAYHYPGPVSTRRLPRPIAARIGARVSGRTATNDE